MNNDLSLMKELIHLLYEEVEALEDTQTQEDLDFAFGEDKRARKAEIERLLFPNWRL